MKTAEQRAREDARAARARWTLLQALVEGQSCLNPQRYQTDCGECVVCALRYNDGAEKFLAAREGTFVPGTFDMRRLGGELREGLAGHHDPKKWS